MGVKTLFVQGRVLLNCWSAIERLGKKEGAIKCANIVGILLTKTDFFVMPKENKKIITNTLKLFFHLIWVFIFYKY